MNEERLYDLIREKEQRTAIAFPSLMKKVYGWMALALVITGLTAYGVASNPSLVEAIIFNRMFFWGLAIAEVALVMYVSARINRLSLATATLLFAIYSALNGATMSVLLLTFTLESITSVFFITAGTFTAMALVGSFVKTDLSGMGRLLMMALIGLIIATVVNIFLKSSGLMMVLNYVGVLIFVGLTAYDTQNIKRMLYEADDMDERGQKLALIGALTLYLDFINLFLYLLRIFGSSKD